MKSWYLATAGLVGYVTQLAAAYAALPPPFQVIATVFGASMFVALMHRIGVPVPPVLNQMTGYTTTTVSTTKANEVPEKVTPPTDGKST